MFVRESVYNKKLDEVFHLRNQVFDLSMRAKAAEKSSAAKDVTIRELQDRIFNMEFDAYTKEALVVSEVQALKNKLTEVYLQAAVNGLEIKDVPEKIVPAKVTPAHLEFKKIKR